MAPARAADLRSQASRRARFRPLGPAAALRADTYRARRLPRAAPPRALVAHRGAARHGAPARRARVGRLGLRPREALMPAKRENRGGVTPDAGPASNVRADVADAAGKAANVKSRIAAYW